MRLSGLLSLLLFVAASVSAQSSIPHFSVALDHGSITMLGSSPSHSETTAIPTVLVPVTLSFAATPATGEPASLSSLPDVTVIRQSPIFVDSQFQNAEHTQYVDALLRSAVHHAADWHTHLASPMVHPLHIAVPPSAGYLLSDGQTGGKVAILDMEYLEKKIFAQLPSEKGKLFVIVTPNTAFYTWGDATICCSWGTHGIDPATGDSFVLGTYLRAAPAIIKEQDIQPLTQQLAEFALDPEHDPLFHGAYAHAPGNHFAAWKNPVTGRCSGTGIGSDYFLLEPTDTNLKNNFPSSKPYFVSTTARMYHLQNVALPSWYGASSAVFQAQRSFPDARTLPAAAQPCRRVEQVPPGTLVASSAVSAKPIGSMVHKHQLIGYWVSQDSTGALFPLHDVSPQWDTIIVAFAAPVSGGSEGALRFSLPQGISPSQFRSEIASLKQHGKTVMLSLGGGGEFFKLDQASQVPVFVQNVKRLVSRYGFQGVDLDFESPSLNLAPGDNNFRHPTTPSIVHLITAMREIKAHFGPKFLLSIVPEGSQVPAGYDTYGGQFGSELPIIYALRNDLSFVDIQDYNTPPMEALDGEIYQSHTVDYHAALADLLLHGFYVGGNRKEWFPPLPARKLVIGFLVGYAQPSIVSHAMSYIMTGTAPVSVHYRLINPQGYPHLLGAMFWNIDMDRRQNYKFSNLIGPQLH
uniref:Glycoside hydrolase n=1 Tax=Acidobacterium capsulatum TaxID=33075 RepID=A0A7V4XQ10_9BACT